MVMPAQWTEQRTPILIPPALDATGGRSYKMASQTAGALGGRRGVVRWHQPGLIYNVRPEMRPTIRGGSWRILSVTARVRVPSSELMYLDIWVYSSDPSWYAWQNIFEWDSDADAYMTPKIPAGYTEANPGTLRKGISRLVPSIPLLYGIYPPGTVFMVNNIGFLDGDGNPVSPDDYPEDLTIEMHHRVMPVAQ